MKYIFVSGGVISGLGKGIITASTSLLLKNLGLKVAPVKVDMYLNVDAGTMRPQEHGETFVMTTGLETDQDMGNYERFLGEDLPSVNYITAGQIYSEVIRKEREFEYEGSTVEAIPQVTDEIIRRIKLAGETSKADVVIVEFGGTITLQEIHNRVFLEASRIMKLKNHNDVLHAHVTYLPFVKSVGELKSKPAQTSVYILNSWGIQPDFIIARSEVPVDKKRADKIALFCNINPDDMVLSPDVDSIYTVPEILDEQKFAEKIVGRLGLKSKRKNGILKDWKKMSDRYSNPKKEIIVGIVAKYYKSGDYDLSDSYVSVLEAIKHAGSELGLRANLKWINSDGLEERKDIDKVFEGIDGIIVPQGWGSRGVEGKIKAIQYARENRLPYLGLCFGMQMAVVEFARNVCGMKEANSEEVNPRTKFPVVHIMPDQKEYLAKKQYGGTIRLGQWPTQFKSQGSKLKNCYQKYKEFCNSYFDGKIVKERHRHRYEVNNKYVKKMESKGLVFSGMSPDGKLVEAIELSDHPFFVGIQYHPELQSRPLYPHPLFVEFLETCSLLKEKTSQKFDKMDAKILVAPTSKLFSEGIWEGFKTTGTREFLDRVKNFGAYARRGDVEENDNFQQVIPQIVLSVGKKILIHRVPQSGSESRLHDLWPIVLGGHVEECDLDIKSAMLREFEEEISYGGKILRKKFLGVVNLQDNPVNSVHVGLVWLFQGDKEKFGENGDDGIVDAKFVTIDEAQKYFEKMTYWSKLIFPKVKEVVLNGS